MFNFLFKRPRKIQKVSDQSLLSDIPKISALTIDLNKRVLAFCDQAVDSQGQQIFTLFADGDSPDKRASLERGLCFGLGHLFLTSLFISDMRKNASSKDNKDLHSFEWFVDCMRLLQNDPKELNAAQKKQLTEFISLTLHFHNIKPVEHIGHRIFSDTIKSNPELSPVLSSNEQYNHVFNSEFSGDNEFHFKPKMGESYQDPSCAALKNLLDYPAPLYVTFSVVSKDSAHCVALYKTNNNEYIFYDPAGGCSKHILNNIDDLLKFKNDIIYENIGLPMCSPMEDKFDVTIMVPAPTIQSVARNASNDKHVDVSISNNALYVIFPKGVTEEDFRTKYLDVIMNNLSSTVAVSERDMKLSFKNDNVQGLRILLPAKIDANVLKDIPSLLSDKLEMISGVKKNTPA